MKISRSRVLLRAKSPLGRFALGFVVSLVIQVFGQISGLNHAAFGMPEEGLYRANELPQEARLESIDAVMDATVYVDAGEKRGSAFIVSNSGYVLTALHVVESLPEVTGLMSYQTAKSEFLFGPRTVTRAWTSRAFARPILLKGLRIPEMGLNAQVSLVALGRLENAYLRSFWKDEYVGEKHNFYEDYALLEVKNPRATSWPC